MQDEEELGSTSDADERDMQEWLAEEREAGPENPYLARVEEIQQRRELERQDRVRDRAAELAEAAQRKTAAETYTEADWEFILEGVPENTRKTYAQAWKWILDWTSAYGYPECPMPVETCVKMIRGHWMRQGRYGRPASPATLRLVLSVLTLAHRHAKRPDGTVGYVTPVQHPDVQRAVRTYRKRWLNQGHRPDKATPITPEELGALVGTCHPGEERGARDALAMTFMYDMGARRSELLAVNFEDVDLVLRVPGDLADREIDWTRPQDLRLYVPADPNQRGRSDRLIVHVPMSKTDQEGAGDEVVLLAHPERHAATCPVRRYIVWRVLLAERGQECTGAVLRQVLGGGPRPTDGRPRKGAITDERMEVFGLESMLARAVAKSGLADVQGRVRRHFALHGLGRAGPAEAAAENGADTPELNRHFRWSQKGTTAQQYAARGLRRKNNPIGRIWSGEDADGVEGLAE